MELNSSPLTDRPSVLSDDPVQRRYREYCLARAQRQKEDTEATATAASRKQLLADQRALLDTPRAVTTRKEHLCTKCQTLIPTGSQAVRVTGKVRVWISRYECKNQHTTQYYCNNCKKPPNQKEQTLKNKQTTNNSTTIANAKTKNKQQQHNTPLNKPNQNKPNKQQNKTNNQKKTEWRFSESGC